MSIEYSPEIKQLLAKGAKDYALKNYEAAVESYAEACELYSALVASASKGEEDSEDPELLYLYGQALYQVAVTMNGLFGGADAQGEENNQEDGEEVENDEEVEKSNGMFQFSEDVPLAEEEDDEEEDGNKEVEQEEEDEEEDAEDQEQEGDAKKSESGQPVEEQQSDFEIAWEILDLSRTLFEHKLSTLSVPAAESSQDLELEYNATLFKIAEIYDLLGEISLETENFPQSIEDFTKSLELKTKLFPFNSNLISEIHYKLSLAYEFNFTKDGHKELAIEHLSTAIKSIEARKEVDTQLIKDLNVKLTELKKDEDEKFNEQKKKILEGILGQSSSTGASSSTAASTSAPANDLTSMVRKRKPKQDEAANKKQKK
ncbi:hypothetical protein WICPIJ_007600 [Wickerhamomyces pijperi]|uniref:Tetratricopeptide SHNi-TPR domain-containing protein n=1 Tax=Wickerhamomyces pijperi TaxID=599730 RepID=A0A9P8PZX8_WICPI|nr:hypothetical protein WICPIJ_007600 [Wickerhamomyces pijperi]